MRERADDVKPRRFDSEGNDIISDINVIPLVDISLVLLIIFMVTATFIMASAINVDIPKAVSGTPAKEQRSVVVTVTADGIIYLQDLPVTTVELKKAMKSRNIVSSGVSVTLRADKSASFKRVVDVLDVLNELGIRKLNIAVAEATK